MTRQTEQQAPHADPATDGPPPDVDLDTTLDDIDTSSHDNDPVIADALPDDVRAELEALAASELDAGGELEQALAEAQREVQRQREATQTALARYREAVLSAEPELPPDLVHGDTLDELDASIADARDILARVRDRVRADATSRGFPVGAPGRDAATRAPLTPAEKIARGLEERG